MASLQEMTAIEIAEPGGPDVLLPVQRPVPLPAMGEVLIRVAFSGVNRPDVLQRMGKYNPPPGTTNIPGLEVSGEIVAVGTGVTQWTIGDSVCALLAGGGYAEYVAVPAVQCLPVPKGLNLHEAAALPETVFTVWTNLFEQAALKAGENVLIHGGSSGIGTTAIQLAAAFGATVLATAGSDVKCRACEKLGASHAINYRTDDFVSVAREATGGKGVDVVLDMVGGDYIPRNLQALAFGGRHASIAFLRGQNATIDLSVVMRKQAMLTGSTLRNRSVEEKGRIAQAVFANVWPLIEAGRVNPVIHATFALTKAADAHRLMESSEHIGKIVLGLR